MRAAEDDPIGAADLQEFAPGRSQVPEQVPPSLTAARGLSGDGVLVHGLMVERLNLRIQRRVDLRLQRGGTVEDHRKIEEPARSQQGKEAGQSSRDIDDVQERMRDQEVPGTLAPHAGAET